MTNVKNIIKRQIDSSGITLLNASRLLSDEEFFEECCGNVSMAWTLGHLAAFQDWAVNRVFLENEPILGRETREALKGGREITEMDRALLPSKAELENFFIQTQALTISTLEEFNEELWDQETPSGCRFPTLGSLWENLGVHNIWHLGNVGGVIPKLVGSNVTVAVPRYYSVDKEDMVNEFGV